MYYSGKEYTNKVSSINK